MLYGRPTSRMPVYRLPAMVGIVFLLAAPGCRSAHQLSPLQVSKGVQDVTAAELRVRIHEFGLDFNSAVIQAANQVMERTTDPAIRLAALQLKMIGIPAGQQAVFHTDPLIAVLDTWVLCSQARQDFEVGDDRDLFGEWQPIVVDAFRRLENEVERIVRETANEAEFQDLHRTVDEWVKVNPLRVGFGRRSIRPLLTQMAKKKGRGTFAAVRGLDASMNDMTDQLKAMSQTMPFQARWQAEYVIEEMLARKGFTDTMERLDSLMEALVEAMPMVAQAPEIISRERNAVLEILNEERVAVLSEVNEQRIDTIRILQTERVAVLDALREERIAAMQVFQEERSIMMQEMEALILRFSEDSWGQVDDLVDRLFWKVAQLIGLLVVTALVFGLIAIPLITRSLSRARG